MSRKDSSATFSAGVKNVFKVDYSDLEAIRAHQQIFVDAALATGVKRFFSAEYGTDTRDLKPTEINPYSTQYKAALVRHGFFGFDFKTRTATLIDDGTTVCSLSRMRTIAKAIRGCIEHLEETKNQYVIIASFHLTQRDMLATIEKLDG
ncbi:hypothetical protein F5883DRAFT_653732 [Diaporthe sp. PMI_573]|nr:hypothetical protein F5883DRAFT_653732 [Diaporthaceae sp. PMI_573]